MSLAKRSVAKRLLGSVATLTLLSTGMLVAASPSEAAAASSTALVRDPAALVNPLIGTGSGGPVVGDIDTFPGADAPFGMVQWGPDTAPNRNDGSGYYYPDTQISGFSLDHISGPGCSGFGDVPILPTVGAIGTNPGGQTEPFSHTTEHASPGYYQVQTGTQPVTTTLSVTPRTGIGTFTFPSSTQANLLIKATGSATGASASSVQVVGDNEVDGSVTAGRFCNANEYYTLHYVIQFEQPFTTSGSWTGSTVSNTPPTTPVTGKNDGIYLTFDTTANQTVTAKVGISFTSAANAALNLKTENPGWSLDAVHAATRASWNAELSRIQIGGGTPADQQLFYTMLYHSLLHPNVFSDVNGQYMGFSNSTTGVAGQVEQAPAGHAEYANYSGWDIYRTEAQLLSMVDPRVGSDMVTSMVDDFQQTGEFPKWSLANGETYVMVGDPADGIIADAHAFGATDFDVRTALADMVTEATTPGNIRPGLNYLESLGYLPADGSYGCCNYYGSVSTTLEYGTADNAIAELARSIGDTATATTFATRSQDWENLYNPANGFIEPKNSNGGWVSGFNPASQNNYVEGDGYQYNWAVPSNVGALVQAEGGRAAFVKRLDTYFTQLNAGPTAPYAWMGNEPSLEDLWEYDYAGAPYRAQAVARQAITQLYSDTPNGEPGNDDLGEMSSWYVWTALGLYPETPGSNTMALGSPLFPREVIHFGSGKTLEINAPNASDGTPYVHGLTVDGRHTERTWLSLAPLVSAAPGRHTTRLHFDLSSTPDRHWGSAPWDAPPSVTTGEKPVIATLGSSEVMVAPGGSATASILVDNVTNRPQRVSVRPAPAAGSGVTAVPATTSTTVPAGRTKTLTVTLRAAADAPQTFSTLTFELTTRGGVSLPSQNVVLLVAPVGALSRSFDNVGVSDDASPATANFDTGGWSYSAEALAKDGLAPGKQITSNGVTYTWPVSPSGMPDNVIANGQTLPLTGPAGADELGVLGSANNGPLSGPLTVNYTSGASQTYELGLSDWTLGAGGEKPSFGNTIAATTPYRNGVHGQQNVATDLFTTTIPLDKSRTVASVTLPTQSGLPALHIFDLEESTAAPTVPVITSASPSTVSAGQQVTITGSGFGATQGSGYVRLTDNGVSWNAPGNSATFPVTSWSDTSITFTVPKPSGPNGEWAVAPGTTATVSVTDASGGTSAAIDLGITPTANLADYYNNVGITSDTSTACGNIDNDGYSLSAQALAAAGITPGKAFQAQGLTYTLPTVAACTPDNITTTGQTMLVAGAPGDTKLGLVGLATNGSVTAPMTIHYSDGSTSTASVMFDDWASSATAPNVTVAAMTYRNSQSATNQTPPVNMFATTVPLSAGKTVTSITFPNADTSSGAMHVFAIALG